MLRETEKPKSSMSDSPDLGYHVSPVRKNWTSVPCLDKTSSLCKEHGSMAEVCKAASELNTRLEQGPLDRPEHSGDVWSTQKVEHISTTTAYQLSSTVVEGGRRGHLALTPLDTKVF